MMTVANLFVSFCVVGHGPGSVNNKKDPLD
eukprot:SAG31_NODE_1699_length_7499_cov_5.315135_6_plen_30_part_00